MSEQTQLAVVGAGLVGKRHIEAMQQVGHVSLCAIADSDANARSFANSLNVPWFESLDLLLSAQKPDGVILATPTVLHIDQALRCLEHGVPVLVEKPIAVHSTDATKLLVAERESRIPVLVGHHRRYNPLVQQARDYIDSGELGVIRCAQCTCWLYKPDDYFEVAPWRTQKGAGPISVNLVHDVDLMRYLLGQVTSVQAMAAPSMRGHENEDVAGAVLQFENNAIATLSVADAVVAPWSWELTARENPCYPPTNQSSLLIGGSQASLSIPDMTLWHHQRERGWWQPISATSSPRSVSDPLCNQIEHFAAVIAGNAIPLVSAEEGYRTLQVIEAIQIAADSGSPRELQQSIQ